MHSLKKAQPQVVAGQEKEIERNVSLLPAQVQQDLAQVEREKATPARVKRSAKE